MNPQTPIPPTPQLPNPDQDLSSSGQQPTPSQQRVSVPGSFLQPISSEEDILRDQQQNAANNQSETPVTPLPIPPPAQTLEEIPLNRKELRRMENGESVSDDTPRKQKIIRWVTIAITGAVLPIAAFILINILNGLLANGMIDSQPATYALAANFVPLVAWLIAASVGAFVIKMTFFNYAYLISLASIILTNIAYDFIGESMGIKEQVLWSWTTLIQMLDSPAVYTSLLLLAAIGAFSCVLFAYLTNKLGRDWPTVLKVAPLLLLIAIPVALIVIDAVQNPIEKSTVLYGYTEENSLGQAVGDGWPVLPTSTPRAYDPLQIEACLKQDAIVENGYKICSIPCVETLEGGDSCVSLTMASGLYDKDSMTRYEYDSAKSSCAIPMLFQAMVTEGEPFESSMRATACSTLKTPKGQEVYAQLSQTGTSYKHYYFKKEKSIVFIDTLFYDSGNVPTEATGQLVEQHVLEFIDTFEVVKK